MDDRLRRHVDAREVLIAQKEETIKSKLARQAVCLLAMCKSPTIIGLRDLQHQTSPFSDLQDRLERRQQEHDEAERRLREQIEGLERDSRDREDGMETRYGKGSCLKFLNSSM